MGKGVEYGAAGGTSGTGIGAFAGLMVVSFVYLKHKNDFNQKIDSDKSKTLESRGHIAKSILFIAFPIIIGTAIFSMANLIDMQMVKSRLLYNNAFTQQEAETLYGQLTGKYTTLTTLPVSIATAFATAVLPNIAASVALKQKETINAKINTCLRITMLISFPATVGVGLLGDQILNLLFPNAPEGGMLLKIGAISIIFLSLNQISTGILQGMGKVYIPALNAIFGVIIKIPINYILIAIPQINVIGAVISSIACYFVASVLNTINLVKYSKAKLDYKGIIFKPLLSSLFMSIVCIFGYNLIHCLLQNSAIATLLTIILSIFVYFISLLFTKSLVKSDILLLPMGNKIYNKFSKYINEG